MRFSIIFFTFISLIIHIAILAIPLKIEPLKVKRKPIQISFSNKQPGSYSQQHALDLQTFDMDIQPMIVSVPCSNQK